MNEDEETASKLTEADFSEVISRVRHEKYSRELYYLSIEALRRRKNTWSNELDVVLGITCTWSRWAQPAKKDVLHDLLVALPLARRSALLETQLGNELYALDAAAWIHACPTHALMAAVCGTGNGPQVHSLVAALENGASLVQQVVYGGAKLSARRTALTEYVQHGGGDNDSKVDALFLELFRAGFGTKQLVSALQRLPLDRREAIALATDLFGDEYTVGPHRSAPTVAVAKSMIAAVFCASAEEAAHASFILETFPEPVVRAALEMRTSWEVAAENYCLALRWCQLCDDHPTLHQDGGTDESAAISHMHIEWSGNRAAVAYVPPVVRALTPFEGGVFACTEGDGLAFMDGNGIQHWTAPDESLEGRWMDVVAVTHDDIVVAGWERMVWYNKHTRKQRGALHLGHGNDGDPGDGYVFSGTRVRTPEGTYVDVTQRDWDASLAHVEHDAGGRKFVQAVAADGGFVLLNRARNELVRWTPESSFIRIHQSDTTIVSFSSDWLALDDGRVLNFAGGELVPRLQLTARPLRIGFQRAQGVSAAYCNYARGSDVWIHENNSLVYSRSYSDRCGTPTGAPGFVLLARGLLDIRTRQTISVPGMGTSDPVAVTESSVYVGTKSGYILRLKRDA